MTTPAHFIAALEHCGMFREYEHAFIELTGHPIALRALNADRQLSFRGKRRENRFCACIRKHNSSCEACLRTQELLFSRATHAPAVLTCKFGLQEIAVPVRLGNVTIGILQTGQMLRCKPDAKRLSRILNELKEAGIAIDEKNLAEAYRRTTVVSRKRLNAIMHLLAIFADHLAEKSNQIAISQITSEPALVVRGKHYIRDHLHENLTLRNVSRAVNASRFHFCKVFRATTGVHFTEYVSRTRVEKAKELLLHHDLQISCIAYRVGFQSLTHFNRMFRRVAGESPTEFRKRTAQLPRSIAPECPPARRATSGRYSNAVPP